MPELKFSNTSLRYARGKLKLKQKDFARLIGVSTKIYGDWERGKTEPSTSHFFKIMQTTGNYDISYWTKQWVPEHRKQEHYLWLRVSTDKYELPEYVADSANELALHYGVAKSTVMTSALRQGKQHAHRYIKVRLEPEDMSDE